MGNTKSEQQTPDKMIDHFKNMLQKPSGNQFNKLSQNTLSIISSFLTLNEYNKLLLVSRSTNDLFSQVSGCYQVRCQKILKVQCELIQSKNWKRILYSLMCIPIKGIPYEKAISSVRHNLIQHPIFFDDKVQLSTFQKSILYFDNQFDSQNTKEFLQTKQFAFQNIDQILKLRQGAEIHVQLPQILMNIYNIHDFIRIYTLYLETRFSKCNLEQFLNLWDHYCGWISILEWSTSQIIHQFNDILEELLIKFKLPKYTIRHFMVSLWLEQAGKISNQLRNEFREKLNSSRKRHIKCQPLRRYIKYLIDISTNQSNAIIYGQYDFPYCQELQYLVNIAIQQTENLLTDYLQDEQMLIYVFGDQVYQFLLFEKLATFRISQFRLEIQQNLEGSNQNKGENNIEELVENSVISSSFKQFHSYVISQYNPKQLIRSLLKSIQLNYSQFSKDEDIEQKIENIQESLGASTNSYYSTDCSSIFSSFKSNDQLLLTLQQNSPKLYNKIEHFYMLQDEIQERKSDFSKVKLIPFDIPELCDYTIYPYEKLVEKLQQLKNKKTEAQNEYKIKINPMIYNSTNLTVAQELLYKILF